jgi:hypothetical protein
MSEDLKELAEKLLRDPFDSGVREQYAEALFAEREWPASLEQFRLLARQEPSSAAGLLGAARCLIEIDDSAAVRMEYEKARQCADFEANGALEEAFADGPKPAFRIVDGGSEPRDEDADIVRISTARETRFVDIVGMEDLKRPSA